MSYILDALKKSEEERKRGDVPGLQTYTPSSLAPVGKKPWLAVAVTLLVVNAGVVVYWAPWKVDSSQSVDSANSVDRDDDTLVSKAASKEAPVRKVPVAKVPVAIVPAISEVAIQKQPVITPVVATKFKPRKPKTIREMQPQPPISRPTTAYMPQLSELPDSIQSQIPDLTFSSHMYSSQERFRSITINGRRLKQGKYFDEHLYVNEITEKGAILGFDGTLFEVDVLGQWGN